jgi:AP-3 complex subunit mu
MERTVFHPCVRLKRWKDEGVISFVPPDGRFVLGGYEVDLLGPDAPLTTARSKSSLSLPATLELNTGLGTNGAEFEVRLSQALSMGSAATASLQSNLSSTGRGGGFKAGSTGDSKGPSLDDLAVHIPISARVRNISDLRPSRGEAHWSAADERVEWRIPAKEYGIGGAVLRCTIQGPLTDEDAEEASGVLNGNGTTSTYDYTDDEPYQRASSPSAPQPSAAENMKAQDRFKELMPTSAALSFSVKGWLPSGLKVESLLVDTKKSRGLGPEVKPYKGVKYLAVSRGGVEARC